MAKPRRVQVRADQVQVGDYITYGEIRGQVVEITPHGRIDTWDGPQVYDFVFDIFSNQVLGAGRHAMLTVLKGQ
ncbi:hypothetical protein [Crossiella sp. CA198]|uniref:hypothetical protein n=1 Tax=Crossiella sp. CA198 TaxID=3455607 RepID=UPI003F8D1D30